MASHTLFAELAADIGFGAEDAALLARAKEIAEPAFGPVVDRFYSVIGQSPAMRALFADDAQIARQKSQLRNWLGSLFDGDYGPDYVARRLGIGRAHVRIGMDQRYMFSMMNVLRVELDTHLRGATAELGWGVDERRALLIALHRLIDLELAIMLETYREHFDRKIRDHERLATLGQLAASIGHELRNPLAVIDTSIHLLRRPAESDPKLGRHLDKIAKQVAISGQIITDLLEMARDRAPQQSATSVSQLVSEALLVVQAQGARIDVRIPELPPALLDPGQIRQVVSNLVQNAAQAVAETPGGTVEVVAFRDESALVLEVLDNGPGLSKEAEARLFEPLFTTRAKGIGLGLALCRRIADKHSGTIRGETRPSGGARFVLTLPRAYP